VKAPAAAQPALLEIEGVAVRREGRTLLERVDLSVARRSIHAIVGPNGAGKSTLLASILGQSAFAGRIRFHWQANGALGYVPQTFHVDRTLPITVAEFLALERQRWPVALGLRPHTRARIDALLERVDLAGFGARRLGALSGGELRRVLVANAIDPLPELLLCDEPASGLDPVVVLRLDQLLRELRDASGTTVLLVSHDMDEVRRVADRVTLLRTTVVASGTPDEILATGWIPTR